MGVNKPTVRTLPTGERVTHYPSGAQVLVPTNTLGGLLDDQHDDQEAASAAKTDALVQSALDKREAQVTGDPVPAEKCPL